MARVSWLDWSSTSAGWVVLLGESNEDAWRRFMERRYPGISAIARRQGLSPADADKLACDLSSKLWIRMREGKFRYDGEQSFNGYVIRMAKNMAIDVLRSHGRQPEPLAEDESFAAREEWDAEDDRRWRALQKALNELRAGKSQDFQIWSRRIGGHSVAEVSKEFAVKPGAIYSACFRINSHLAKVAGDHLAHDSESS